MKTEMKTFILGVQYACLVIIGERKQIAILEVAIRAALLILIVSSVRTKENVFYVKDKNCG